MHEQRSPTGVLLMAYGTPETLDDVEAYYTHIRHGHRPPPAQVEDLRERYRLVGGTTPLLEISRATATGLQERLDTQAPGRYRVYLGMKHWHPYIAATVAQMAADGITEGLVLTLAPHYSKMSVGSYCEYIDEAQAKLATPIALHIVQSWHQYPQFRALIAARIRETLAEFPPGLRDQVTLLFSAHSLPERIKSWGDPYEEQLLESSAGVAALLGWEDWRFCYQSAGATSEPWLGPDIVAYLDELGREGKRAILSVPFGFVADHLEVFYDIDYEAQAKAKELGIPLRRIRMPNADPQFIDVLAAVVADQDAARLAGLSAPVDERALAS